MTETARRTARRAGLVLACIAAAGAGAAFAGTAPTLHPAGSMARRAAPAPDLPAGRVRHLLQTWRRNVRDGSAVPPAERRRLTRGITRYMPAGVDLQLLQFIGGPRDGVLIRMSSAAPASALQALEPVVSYVGRAGALGAFQLRDPSGGTVWVAGFFRNGGFVWTRPDLDACGPIAHGGGAPVGLGGWAGPPATCPADG